MKALALAAIVSAVLASGLVSGPATAQTLIGWDGLAVVDEWTGPPDPTFCGYPSGPLVSSFPLLPVGCPGVFPIGPPMPGMPGGVAYDSITDTVYVSDGGLVESYTAGGVFLDSFLAPLPVFGLGFDSMAGLLWATDGGALIHAFAPPPLPACGGPVPPLMVFPAPFPFGPLSGIDWDPMAGVLWVSDLAGMVQDVLPGGGPGFFGPFPVVPGPCFPGPIPTILRLAVDDGSPFGPGHLYLSDGFTVASILPGGAPAPPTFAFPGAPPGAPCFPHPVPQIGIAFAPHGIPYGAGLDPDGFLPPVIGSTGASTIPGPAFTHTLSSAVAGGVAFLVVGIAPACPTIPILGVPAHVSPIAFFFVLGPAPVGLGGTAILPTPIPPTAVPGTTLFSQWVIFKPAGPSPFQASDGLSFRTSVP